MREPIYTLAQLAEDSYELACLVQCQAISNTAGQNLADRIRNGLDQREYYAGLFELRREAMLEQLGSRRWLDYPIRQHDPSIGVRLSRHQARVLRVTTMCNPYKAV